MAGPIYNIPFSSQNMTWENWNGNMLHYFSAEPMPYLPEEKWQDFARNLAMLPSFTTYPIPSPELFSDWRDWAKEFTEVINGVIN